MPKRVAEHQLTKDGGEAGSDEEGNNGGVTAPVEGRVIRGMPKRKGAAAAAPAAAVETPAAASASPFGGGFSFGAGASGSSTTPITSFGSSAPAAGFSTAKPTFGSSGSSSGFSFGSTTAKVTFGSSSTAPAAGSGSSATPASSFGAKQPEPEIKKTAAAPFSGFSFGAEPQPEPAKKAPFSGFSFGASSTKPAEAAPAVAAAAEPQTEAGKKSSAPFSGFSFGASSTKPAVPTPATPQAQAPIPIPSSSSSQQASSTPAQTTSSPDAVDEKETEYLIQLRGLNTSILSFLSNQLENDPLLDLSSALAALGEQYESKLQQVSIETGYKRAQAQKSVPTPAPAKPAPTPAAKMPAPPVAPPSVGSFKLLAPAASSTSQTSGGFVPTLPAAPSGGFSFGFGAKAAEKKKETETSKLVGDLIADGANGDAAAEEQKSKSDKQWQVPAMFKGSVEEKDSVEENKEEAPAAPAPTPIASVSTPSKAGLFSFGPSNPTATAAASTPPKTFSFASSAPAAKLGKFGPGGSTPSLSFGASSTPTGTPSTAAKSGFSFGATSTPSGSGSAPSFSFGSPAAAKTDAPKTSGFSFGSSSTAPAASKAPFSFGQASGESKPSSFSGFGAPAAASTSTSTETSTEASTDAEAAEDGAPSVNLAATVGAGEENEETVIEQRCKVFKLDGGKQNSLGIVVLRLKREKAGGDSKRKRRILARMDPGGSVVLNFGLNASMKPVVNGNTVAFMGFDSDGKPANYTLRIKTPDMAAALGDALRKEAEEVASGQ